MSAANTQRAPRRAWAADEVEFLRLAYPNERTALIAQTLGRRIGQVHQKAAAMGLLKSREAIAAEARINSAKPGHGGQRTQIKPGNVPWNKGLTGSTGHHANSRGNWFKPGTLNGRTRSGSRRRSSSTEPALSA